MVSGEKQPTFGPLKILSGPETDTSTGRPKNFFATLPTPNNNQNEAAAVGFMGERRRQMRVSRDARFMVVPAVGVCCGGVERRL